MVMKVDRCYISSDSHVHAVGSSAFMVDVYLGSQVLNCLYMILCLEFLVPDGSIGVHFFLSSLTDSHHES